MIRKSEGGTVTLLLPPDLELARSETPLIAPLASYRRLGKTLFDAVVAAIGLLATSPLLLICAVAVWLDTPGPIFFRQRRIGQHGRPFNIIKFRTMIHHAERSGPKITADGDLRITAIGRWLRRSKLDELPQLFNVLKGDMSLVGPRPEVPEYVAAYDSYQKKVLELKPGITGPASVAYIDEEKVLAGQSDKEAFYLHTLMPQKLEFDMAYCEGVSFSADIKLICATMAKLFDTGKEAHDYFPLQLLPSRALSELKVPQQHLFQKKRPERRSTSEQVPL